ncbi:hypothetical protein [Streptomyces sp. NPDC029674]|uniref:hypothetical protein n=1 Tax=Streptomyces sp. NPDC029674 TaxID=3365297 RepID=UPI003851567C
MPGESIDLVVVDGIRWLPWLVLVASGFACAGLVARLHRGGHLTALSAEAPATV